MSSEHRNEARHRVFLKGRIHFNNGASSMDCLVRDLSPAGARLALSESATLPEIFDLYIPQKERTFRSALRWRRADGVGVTFEDAAKPAPAAEAAPVDPAISVLLRRIGELEAENATLRSLLVDMAQDPTAGDAPATAG